MDLEQWDPVQASTLEPGEGEETRPVEIVLGLRHLVLVVALFAAAVFVAGFGWWTLSGTVDFSELKATLLAEPGQESPVAGQATAPFDRLRTARPVVPTVSSARPPRRPEAPPELVEGAPRAEPRQMALPPVRKGFTPQPEASSVKGDSDAPITIVEYSDYQ